MENKKNTIIDYLVFTLFLLTSLLFFVKGFTSELYFALFLLGMVTFVGAFFYIM